MEFMARGRQWRVCIAAGRVCSDRLKQIHYKRTAQRGQTTQRPADLIGEIEESSDNGLNKDRNLLLEHLRSARHHLFGAMPLEYSVDLENAAFAAEVIADENLRQRVMTGILDLLDEVPGLATRQTYGV